MALPKCEGSSKHRPSRLVATSIARIAGKNHEAVGGDDNVRGTGQAVHGRAAGVDPPAVARDDRVDPVVVDIAVEDLQPEARTWESRARTASRSTRSSSRRRRRHGPLPPASAWKAITRLRS